MIATATTEEEDEVSVTEAARRLKVLHAQAYNLLWAGRLKGRKIGKRWLIDVHSINGRLEALRTLQALRGK
jgi:hypothetical protein